MKTTKANQSKLARVFAALQASGTRLFRCESCDPEFDAKRNLEGKTYYCTESTMQYFKSRILSSGRSPENLVFWIIESVNSRPDHGGRNKRFVAFDVFGTVLNDRAGLEDCNWHRTSEAAMKEGREWLASFDAVKHTAETLKARAHSDIANAKRTLAALRSLSAVAKL